MTGVFCPPVRRSWLERGQRKNIRRKRSWWLQGQAAGLARGKLLCLRETEAAVKVTKQKITVSYMGRTGLLGGLTAKEEEQAARLNPTKRLRSIRELKKL